MRPWSRYEELKNRIRDQPELIILKRPGQRKTAKSVLDPADTWKTSALFDKKRAAATLERARRGFQGTRGGGQFSAGVLRE